jgi:hypothetical protein
MEENNKIIAEFIDIIFDANRHKPYEDVNGWRYEDLKFHSDWNWLMKVVEKIFKDFYKINPCPIYLKINIENALNEVDIESVYNACVEFINFYNKQKEE